MIAAAVLRLHVAGGLVWYGTSAGAKASGMTPLQFSNHVIDLCGELSAFAEIRLIGCEANAKLLLQLLRQLPADGWRRIWLGSPDVCYGQALVMAPGVVLQCLYKTAASAALAGHWHRLTSSDVPMYRLLASRCNDNDAVLRRQLDAHPAWPALSFVPGLSLPHAALLLWHIVDPRWYTHVARPGRLTRLFAHLRLTPAAIREVLKSGPEAYLRRSCTAAAVFSWYRRDPSLLERTAPGAFLQRIREAAADETTGILRATQRFVRFVCLMWLAGLEQPHCEAGFMPEMFFKTPAEIEAFKSHQQRLAASAA